jgi:hypothetical protein
MDPVRALPDPGFAGDDGSASPDLVAALTAYDAEPDSRHNATLTVLQHERLLVPVVAVLGEVEHDEHGLAHDKTSDMAAVLIRGRDGRNALLAFTCLASLRRWDPAGRPVPITTGAAAEAALDVGAAALVVDVAGPVTFVVEDGDLGELARGSELVRGGGELDERYGWVTSTR